MAAETRRAVIVKAQEAGWEYAGEERIEGYATWIVDTFRHVESESVMELLWVVRSTARGVASLKHGVYECSDTGAKGEVKAVTGPGSKLYASVDRVLKEHR